MWQWEMISKNCAVIMRSWGLTAFCIIEMREILSVLFATSVMKLKLISENSSLPCCVLATPVNHSVLMLFFWGWKRLGLRKSGGGMAWILNVTLLLSLPKGHTQRLHDHFSLKQREIYACSWVRPSISVFSTGLLLFVYSKQENKRVC